MAGGAGTRRQAEVSETLVLGAAYALAGLLAAPLGWWLWVQATLAAPADGAAALPDYGGAWPGAVLGLGLGVALAFALVRLAQGLAARRALTEARAKAARAGLILPQPTLSLLRPQRSERALAELVEQAVFQSLSARKEKEKFQDALAKVADPTLSSRLRESTSMQAVGTQKIRCAVLFCDIRGFTKMSETLTVEEVVYVLNDYFAVGSQAISAEHGQINKFIGDAILAVFQDPAGHMTGSTACRNAATAAEKLVAVFRRQRNVWTSKISTPFDVDLGVGVHYGELIMGNFGSPQRMEYTVIGDTVNYASRLCSLAQRGQVRLSDEVWALVSGHFNAQAQEPVAVKGKSGLFQTWLLDGKKSGY